MAVGERCVIHLEGSCYTQWLTNLCLIQQYLEYCGEYENGNPENLEGFSCWKFRGFITTVVKMKVTRLPKCISDTGAALKRTMQEYPVLQVPSQESMFKSISANSGKWILVSLSPSRVLIFQICKDSDSGASDVEQ